MQIALEQVTLQFVLCKSNFQTSFRRFSLNQATHREREKTNVPVEKDAQASFWREKTTFEEVELIVVLVEQADARGVARWRPHGLVMYKKKIII